jgi:hypothetical protein
MMPQTIIQRVEAAADVEPVTFPLTRRLSVRLYRDCRPNCLETASLQKGLVLLADGQELIEEGVGFGVPVVKYKDKTFFSSKADITVARYETGYLLTKTFLLDTISIKKLGSASYINDKLYSTARKTFQLLYLKHKRLYPLFNKVMEIRDLFGVKTEFQTVKPRGTITITYQCQSDAVKIHADLTSISHKHCQEVLLLNEQGSSIFQTYTDNTGTKLRGNQIGAWDRVTANSAALLSSNGRIAFSVRGDSGGSLFRGWEHTRKRFSWAGLSYSIQPYKNEFDYCIDLQD